MGRRERGREREGRREGEGEREGVSFTGYRKRYTSWNLMYTKL